MKKAKNNQSIQNTANQLIRYYSIPVDRKKEDVLNTILTRIEQQENKNKRRPIKLSPVFYSGLAAALIMLLLVLHFFTATVTFSGKNNESLAYRLPDHSRVVLENNSDVRFSKYFWKRKISLRGTAYFEVEKGSKFRVNTKLGSVEVLGTRFLVDEHNDSLNVQCFEGRVKAMNKQSSYVLESGTMFRGTKKSGEKISVPNHVEYPDFARFNKNFPNVSLGEVVKDLESFFGVQIDMQNGNGRNFSGTIQTGKLESALEIICQSMQLKYKYVSKYKVTIFK
ncbi:MAG TPA: FecR family protein [Draconibacterium sp.]|nr:FecR family protein [Draconibacterium sp.]